MVVDESDLALNVWLHRSVGRAIALVSWRSQVRVPLSPDFFFQASSFQLLKIIGKFTR